MLDPFAGAGTTLVEAQMCGLSAVGYEPHPFFAEMARAKLATDLTCDDLGDSLEQILLGGVAIGTDPWGGVVGDATDARAKLLPEKSLAQLGIRPIAVRGNRAASAAYVQALTAQRCSNQPLAHRQMASIRRRRLRSVRAMLRRRSRQYARWSAPTGRFSGRRRF